MQISINAAQHLLHARVKIPFLSAECADLAPSKTHQVQSPFIDISSMEPPLEDKGGQTAAAGN